MPILSSTECHLQVISTLIQVLAKSTLHCDKSKLHSTTQHQLHDVSYIYVLKYTIQELVLYYTENRKHVTSRRDLEWRLLVDVWAYVAYVSQRFAIKRHFICVVYC